MASSEQLPPEKRIRAEVEAFRSNTDPIIDRARLRTIARLGRMLTFAPNGRIQVTAANQRALRRVDKIFLEELARGGYEQSVAAFVNSFPGQLPEFREALDRVGAGAVTFDAAAQQHLASQQITSRAMLRAAVHNAALTAQSRAAFGIGAMKFEDLAQSISDTLGASAGRAGTIATTAIASYHRLMTLHAGEQLPDARYRFANILDGVTRPWCRRMVERSARESWTRQEIDQMTNGSGLPVFLSGGGWNCRGTWLLYLPNGEKP